MSQAVQIGAGLVKAAGLRLVSRAMLERAAVEATLRGQGDLALELLAVAADYSRWPEVLPKLARRLDARAAATQ